MSAKENFVVPFLGALQASIAVLLTISYGVIAAQFNLVSQASAKDISKACVRLFLPALLIVNVGSQLHLDTVRSIPASADRTKAMLICDYRPLAISLSLCGPFSIM